MTRSWNFYAGPATLPLSVLEKARDELVEWEGTGMSVMETSHRSKEYDRVHHEAMDLFAELLGLDDDHAVLFLQGGASLQFAMIPMNFVPPGGSADYVITGSWSQKALKEAGIVAQGRIAGSSEGSGFTSVPIAGWGANVVRDPERPGTVWACANLEVVRTDGSYRYSRENVDLPELNPMHDVLTTVAAAPGGIAWVGSTEGLFRLDAEAGTHEWFHSSNSAIDADQVTPLAVTPDGRIWYTNFNSLGYERSIGWYADLGCCSRTLS